MKTNNHVNPEKRHDILAFIDFSLSNPNGDPNADNFPRTIAVDDLLYGIITDVCIKRKIRNTVWLLAQEQEYSELYQLLMEADSVINNTLKKAYDVNGIQIPTGKKKITKEQQTAIAKYILTNYYDARMFGAVLSTGDCPAGVHSGALQVTFAKTLNPLDIDQITITRCCATNEKEDKDNKTMGRKAFINYGLYAFKLFYSPHRDKHGVISEQDLAITYEALLKMCDLDKSAARSESNLRGLYVFSHSSKYGDVPAHKLFDAITIESDIPKDEPAKSFSDYRITINQEVITKFESLGGTFSALA